MTAYRPNRRALLGNAVAAGGLLALPACSRDEPQVRYRLWVGVDTPAGRRRGTGVIGLTRHSYPSIQSITGTGYETRIAGEAVAVDLPGGRALYMLLARLGLVDHIAPMLSRSNAFADAFTPIAPDAYPAFVTFLDPRDPASVRAVDPAALDRTFGAGYRLAGVVVTLTDAPVSRTIDRRLPWAATLRGALSGSATTGGPTVADELTTLAFRRML